MTPLGVALGPSTATVDLVAFGENSLDFVARLAGPRERGATKHPLAAFEQHIGGQMATAAVGSRRLGLRTRYVGTVGDDDHGRSVRAALTAEGVDVCAIVRGAASRIAVVVVDADGERVVYERAPAELQLAVADLPLGPLMDARVLLVDATQAASVEAAREARRGGRPVIVDIDRVTPTTDLLLDVVDIIICPEPFALTWSGAARLEDALVGLAQRFPGAAAVVATRAEQGSLALARGHWTQTPGFRVAIVDTTGAGDAFRAGFAAAWVRSGESAPLEAILTAANATAALNCRAVGAQGGLPTWDEVEQLCNAEGRWPV